MKIKKLIVSCRRIKIKALTSQPASSVNQNHDNFINLEYDIHIIWLIENDTGILLKQKCSIRCKICWIGKSPSEIVYTQIPLNIIDLTKHQNLAESGNINVYNCIKI